MGEIQRKFEDGRSSKMIFGFILLALGVLFLPFCRFPRSMKKKLSIRQMTWTSKGYFFRHLWESDQKKGT